MREGEEEDGMERERGGGGVVPDSSRAMVEGRDLLPRLRTGVML